MPATDMLYVYAVWRNVHTQTMGANHFLCPLELGVLYTH